MSRQMLPLASIVGCMEIALAVTRSKYSRKNMPQLQIVTVAKTIIITCSSSQIYKVKLFRACRAIGFSKPWSSGRKISAPAAPRKSFSGSAL